MSTVRKLSRQNTAQAAEEPRRIRPKGWGAPATDEPEQVDSAAPEQADPVEQHQAITRKITRQPQQTDIEDAVEEAPLQERAKSMFSAGVQAKMSGSAETEPVEEAEQQPEAPKQTRRRTTTRVKPKDVDVKGRDETAANDDDTSLRTEMLRLAVQSGSNDPVGTANQFLRFVRSEAA